MNQKIYSETKEKDAIGKEIYLNVKTIDEVRKDFGIDLKKIFGLKKQTPIIEKLNLVSSENSWSYVFYYPLETDKVLSCLRKNNINNQNIIDKIFSYPIVNTIYF